MSNEMLFSLFFYLLAGITVVSSIAVVTLRNLVHSAFFLALAFVGVAGIYVLMQADFLAAVQILVYGGAIAILIAFGVMMTRGPGTPESNPANSKTLGWGALVSLGVFAAMAAALDKSQFTLLKGPAAEENAVEGIAKALLTDFVVPFEMAAFLLLVAMVGAIILARGVRSK